MTKQVKNWIFVTVILILAIFLAFFATPGRLAERLNITVPDFMQRPYKLGLDLQGGISLLYQADLSQVPKEDWQDSMEGLRDIIERRLNPLGVQEPVVQIQKHGQEYRLSVEIAGVVDPAVAIEMIGKTPYLEFREEVTEEEKEEILNELRKEIGPQANELTDQIFFKPTELTGKYLKEAKLEFDPITYKPQISLEFDSEGAKLFEEITERNVGKILAIYIDNQLLSAPMVNEKIAGGKAQITGDFTIEEAKELVQNLNGGALPVPIKLISQKNIGPSLGEISVEKTMKAGIIGFLAIIVFLLIFYRLPGFFASISLGVYLIFTLTLFKLIPVTLTLAGIAGFLLSLGMAVDANILMFSRMREELKQGKSYLEAIDNGFHRAWPAIRDGNFTTILVGIILFFFGTSFVQGFAFTLIIGNLISMVSAIFITNAFLKLAAGTKLTKFNFLW